MVATLSAIKLRLQVDEQSARILDSQSRMCNWLYNHLVETANTLRETYCETQDPVIAKTLYTRLGLRNLIPKIKAEHPFLKTVHSSPLKNVGLRLTECIQTYQKSRKGKRKGKETGWPRFRSWSERWFSLLYDEPGKGYKVLGSELELSLGLGEDRKQYRIRLKIKEASLLKNKLTRNCRIVKDNGVFSAVFTVARELPESKSLEKILCIDPNHQNLGYGIDHSGEALEIERPYWLKHYDKRIDEIKSKRDHCLKKSYQMDVCDAKGNQTGKKRWVASRQWRHYDQVLKKVLAKRREQTKTYCYTISNKLYQHYDLIAVGDYTPRGGGINKGMRRSMNNRSLIGRFKETLSWVAMKSGKHYVEYNETGTTRTCHACEHREQKGISPKLRRWTCPQCLLVHSRDENAAINGLRKVLRNETLNISAQALLVPSSGHVLVTKRCAWRVQPSGVKITLRGLSGRGTASVKKLNGLRGSDLPLLAHG